METFKDLHAYITAYKAELEKCLHSLGLSISSSVGVDYDPYPEECSGDCVYEKDGFLRMPDEIITVPWTEYAISFTYRNFGFSRPPTPLSITEEILFHEPHGQSASIASASILLEFIRIHGTAQDQQHLLHRLQMVDPELFSNVKHKFDAKSAFYCKPFCERFKCDVYTHCHEKLRSG